MVRSRTVVIFILVALLSYEEPRMLLSYLNTDFLSSKLPQVHIATRPNRP